MLMQVLLQGSQVQRVSAAWLVSCLAARRSEADRAAVKAAGEFCKVLAAAGAVSPLLELLLRGNAEQTAAGKEIPAPHQCIFANSSCSLWGHCLCTRHLLVAGESLVLALVQPLAGWQLTGQLRQLAD